MLMCKQKQLKFLHFDSIFPFLLTQITPPIHFFQIIIYRLTGSKKNNPKTFPELFPTSFSFFCLYPDVLSILFLTFAPAVAEETCNTRIKVP